MSLSWILIWPLKSMAYMVFPSPCCVPHSMRFAYFLGGVISPPRGVKTFLVESTSPLISLIMMAVRGHLHSFGLSSPVLGPSYLGHLKLPAFSRLCPIKSEWPPHLHSLPLALLLPLLLPRFLHLERRTVALAAPREVGPSL
ncbi:hypothetical protein B296_00053525 [Ensete ventricosum]|uniref:Uncharacterized protein n=1 Tax=Ensete ventricosum TaxID=4639 RepID=A0A426XXE9_ENSVE|nr:hypothetical protein B296_00053525 [Ensete ventricosum]